MSVDKLIEALNSGRERWESFSQSDRTAWSGQTRTDPSGKKIRIIQVNGQSLSNKSFEGFTFEGIDFVNTTFNECSFKKANFIYSNLDRCTFHDCNFEEAQFEHSPLYRTTAINTNFSRTFWGENSRFQGVFTLCNLENAQFYSSDSAQSLLGGCNVKGAQFGRSNLSEVIWSECLIDRHTDFQSANLNSQIITKDSSETTRYVSFLRKHYFNWRAVQTIGKFPILGFSWVIFLSSLFLINTVGAINELDPPLLDGMEDLPIPHDALWILTSSLLLALGSTIYAIFCPGEVKSFSETEWLYEHKHPRIEYLVSALQKPVLQAVSVLSLTVGTGMGLWLVYGRILDAFKYVIGG